MAGEGKSIPRLLFIMIAVVYGVQDLVFIMRRKWDVIGRMLFYIMPIPAFFLPLYSFWRMDNFSWGQIRVVLGESGKKMIVRVRTHLPFSEYTTLTPLYIRTKGCLILGQFLSSHGVLPYRSLTSFIRKTSSGTRNRITASGLGSLKPKQKNPMQILALLLYMAEKLTTNLKDAASHQPHLSLACTHLQDTN